MDRQYIWLVLVELSIILIVVITKLVGHFLEAKKINSILEFIEQRAKEKEIRDKFNECLDIIEKNKNRKEDE